MAYSGTYGFQPSTGELALNAFARIQIRRTEITQQHLSDAANEANMVQVEFGNRQPNLWSAETYEVPLVPGTASYTIPSRLISPMAVYITTESSGGTSFDRIIFPLSTFEYAALPEKEQSAPPTSYWFDREIEPKVYTWPVTPDDGNTYTLKLRILSQLQDAKMQNGGNAQLPYRWLDAFTAALAARLATIYKPELEDKRKADAERAWQIAAQQDTEDVPIYILPGIGGYYR
jgi:hypothetical protein